MQIRSLNRQIKFDDRSRDHAIRPFLGSVTRKKQIWTMPGNFPLNQGREGACVGFGWAAELACDPVRIPATQDFASLLYQSARDEDAKTGYRYPDGASVLGGAQACKNRGYISGYRWAFGIDDVIDTLVAKGPVVLGINWYDGMYETAQDGLVIVNGPCVGGHCILATGYWPNHPVFHTDVIQWTNSWGANYGENGKGYIRVSDLDMLLQQQGEACIATDVAPQPKRPWWVRLLDRF